MKAYIIIKDIGEYEDHYRIIEDHAYFDKEKAQRKVDELNNKFKNFKLTAGDWMNWYDVLDLKYAYSEDPDVFDPFANEDIFYETISKEIPDALQKYTEGEIKDIYKYNMTNEYYDYPIYSIQEIEIS